jgi:MFS family permease
VSGAARTRAFWLLASATALNGFVMGGTNVHRIPYWVELGFAPHLVSLAMSANAAAAAAMILVAGVLLDRFPARFVAAASFAGFAGAVALMLAANSVVHLFVSTVMFGLCVGIRMVVQTHIWADYYGRANLGALRGVTMPAQLLASAIGAPVVGYVYDITGSYAAAWWLLIAMLLGAFLIMMFALPPRARPDHTQSHSTK